MSERAPVSKKLRFEVFKRDSFTCQYCGRKAPDVILHCDHLIPVALDGGSDILNLVTSCVDCNSGKGARALSDNAVLVKQVDQLSELQDRREQLEMMIDWRKGLDTLQEDEVEAGAQRWSQITEGTWNLSKTGRDKLRKTIRTYGLDLTLTAMRETMDSYAKRGEDQAYEEDSIGIAFSKLGGVARVLRDMIEKPYLKRIFYIRGILRNRLHYCDDRQAVRLMERAGELDVDFDSLERIAKGVRSWTQFRETLEAYIFEHSGDDK